MLSGELITDIAQYIKDRVKSAEVVFDDKEPESVQIIRKDIKDNTLKVFVNTTKGKGTITDIRLLDDKGSVLISKPRGTIKTIDHAIVSTFWIKIVEEEIEDPISIFELKEGLNG